MRSGIYKITNNITGDFYIGSAINLYNREAVHFSTLKNNKHHNIYLQRSFNKHGILNFTFEIICECLKEDLIKLEQFYIDEYKPKYNICKIAGNTLGVVCSEETKKKISNAHLGKKLSEEHIEKIKLGLKNIKRTKNQYKNRLKPIYKLCPITFKILESFGSITEASDKLKIDHSFIAKTAKGYKNVAGGYCWCFQNDYNIERIKQQFQSTRGHTPIEQYDKNMNLIVTHENIKTTAKFLNVSFQAVYNCVHEKTKSCGGFILKFKNIKNG